MSSIVVCGYMARLPSAGNLLAYFQYVLGLDRLGHDVTYVEESGWPYSAYDVGSGEWVGHPAAGLRTVRDLVDRHCPGVRVVWVDRDTGEIDGATRRDFLGILDAADLLLNVGGVCWLDELKRVRRRALIDMDPFFSQVGGFASKVLADYDAHFSYGTNVGRPGCTVPTLGINWVPTLPPVVMDLWSTDRRPQADAAWTTVSNWRSYGGIEHAGEHYGQKDEEFLRILDLPSMVPHRLQLALSGGEEVFPLLRAHGWNVRDASEISADLDGYITFIRSSRGELSVAKNAYVKTSSGWFSDRTASYLAAGRPVVIQTTGSDAVPTGCGLLTFVDAHEAAAALREVERHYPNHSAAASALARTHLAHEVVLPRLVDCALASA